MKQELDKCVLVIDEAMPRGLAANTAAILGITWGRLRPELVGEDVILSFVIPPFSLIRDSFTFYHGRSLKSGLIISEKEKGHN